MCPYLLSSGRLLNSELGHAGLDGLGHAAQGLHFLDDLQRRVRQVLGQRLHHVGPAPGVRHAGDLGLLLQDQLRVAGDARTELRGQAQRLVECVRVQRLTCVWCGVFVGVLFREIGEFENDVNL